MACFIASEGISLLSSKQLIFMHFVEGQWSSHVSSLERNNSTPPCADCSVAYSYEFIENEVVLRMCTKLMRTLYTAGLNEM
jgi:hypothetical protein